MTLYAGLEGPGAAPGNYTARISGGNEIREAGFMLAMDPRITASPAEIQEWTARLDETAQLLDDILTSLGELRKSHSQIAGLMESYPDDASLQASGTSALETIGQWDHQIIQPLHETLEDEDAWETMLAGQVRFVLDVIDSTGAPVTEGALARLADLKSEWSALESQLESIRSDHINPINEWARSNSVPHVSGN
jgi:chromosome segregation ATPase